MAEATLFDKIGGMGAVNAAVDIFYTKVLKDDLIKHFLLVVSKQWSVVR